MYKTIIDTIFAPRKQAAARHNKKSHRFFLTLLSSCAVLVLTMGILVGCDDGAVDETVSFSQEGRTVKLTASVTGLETWPTSLYVALAAFDQESNYAITSRRITSGDGSLSLVLTGISDEATSVELCVLNNLRQRVATFAKIEGQQLQTETDTIPFNAGDISLSMLSAIQTAVFNTTCIGCHGENGSAAAGLFLTEGRSHESLVGKTSRRVAEKMLVQPYNGEESVLYEVLTTDLSKGWHYDHTGEILDQNRRQLILEWINNGAQDN